MLGLRHQRESMVKEGLIHGESHFPPSFTLMVAVLLLLLGIAAIASVVLHAGPLD
jgi:putative membrane protein